MDFTTDKKRVFGLGSGKHGAEHHWSMIKSSVGLLLLVPLFVFSFGSVLGSSYEDVLAHFSRPFPAIVTALTIVAGLWHFKNGVQVLIEDYSQGLVRQGLIIATTCLSYTAMGAGLFAMVRLSLG